MTKNMMRTRFGREDRDREFTKLLKPIELVDRPGPGQYCHQTQFDNRAKYASSVKNNNGPKKLESQE